MLQRGFFASPLFSGSAPSTISRARLAAAHTKEYLLSAFVNNSELAYRDKYDYIIVNDDVEKAAMKMEAILLAEKCRSQAYQFRSFIRSNATSHTHNDICHLYRSQ